MGMPLLNFQVTPVRRTPASLIRKSWGWLGGSWLGGWWRRWIHEPFKGAWQKNEIPLEPENILAHHAVFRCIGLIAGDVGKLRYKLVEQDGNNIWQEVTNPAFSPVLRKPNHFQTHIQFKELWLNSKLMSGNTYVLKRRDARGVVIGMYILDPFKVTPMVTPGESDVFYRLDTDDLAGVIGPVVVPAREIMHDRWNCLFHPLCGLPPLYAAALPADVGLRIARNSSHFFGKGSNPSGIVTAPEAIEDTVAAEYEQKWNKKFSGPNSGAVAVLGGGLAFTPLRMASTDAQLIEQLKWSAETVCSVFGVPPFKVHIGQLPTYQNGETLERQYYSDCLQFHIESMEAVLDEGLVTGDRRGVMLDLDGLLRMDSKTLFETLAIGVTKKIMAPNEARARVDLPPVEGGERVYAQQQDFPLDVLAARTEVTPAPAPTPDPNADDEEAERDSERARAYLFMIRTQHGQLTA